MVNWLISSKLAKKWDFAHFVLFAEIALEVVRKSVVSFVPPLWKNGYEVAWWHRFQAKSWKHVVPSGGIREIFRELHFSLWAAACWSNIPYHSLWRTWFRFCRCFRWGSCHLKHECLFWAVLLVRSTVSGLVSYPKMSGLHCPLQVIHSWLTEIGTMMPDVLQSEMNPGGLRSSLYPHFLGASGVFVSLLCCHAMGWDICPADWTKGCQSLFCAVVLFYFLQLLAVCQQVLLFSCGIRFVPRCLCLSLGVCACPQVSVLVPRCVCLFLGVCACP